MKKLALIFSVVAVGFIFGCAKKDNNTTAATYTYNTLGQCVDQNGQPVQQTYCTGAGQYSYNNYGQCIQTSTGTVVANQLCTMNTNSQYQYVNGMCIYTLTGQQVSPTLCQTTTNSGFQYVNGMCIQISTGQQYPTNYCQTNGGVISQQCYGYYKYNMNGQIYNCGVTTNCSGALMTNLQTQQQVQCL